MIEYEALRNLPLVKLICHPNGHPRLSVYRDLSITFVFCSDPLPAATVVVYLNF